MSERHRKLHELKQKFKAAYDDVALKQCTIDKCLSDPICAHTLQRGSILKYLSGIGERNSEGVYYLEDRVEYDFKNLKITSLQTLNKVDFKPISAASTFYGFCKMHDEVFNQEIENVNFDQSDRMAFYHSFRTFAHSLRKEAETLEYLSQKLLSDLESLPEKIDSVKEKMQKVNPVETIPDDLVLTEEEMIPLKKQFNELADSGYSTNDDVRKTMEQVMGGVLNKKSVTGKDIKELFIKANDFLTTNPTINDLDPVIEQLSGLLPPQMFDIKLNRGRLSHLFDTKQFGELSYFTNSITGVYPIAGAFVAGYLDNILAPFNDGYVVMPRYAVTFFPEPALNRSTFVIASYKENPNVNIFFSRLRIMNDSDFKQFISNLILLRGTNTFFSPRYWAKLLDDERQLILQRREFKKDTEFGIYNLGLNLFEIKFED